MCWACMGVEAGIWDWGWAVFSAVGWAPGCPEVACCVPSLPMTEGFMEVSNKKQCGAAASAVLDLVVVKGFGELGA